MTYRVEAASRDQLQLVHRIMLEAFAEYLGVLQPSSSSHLESLDDVARAAAEGGAIIVWDDEVAVGSARYRRRDGYLNVERVAVLPAHRRRGIATLLMRWHEEFAAQLGYSRVQVAVRMSLPSNLAFYYSLGYRLVGVEPHPKGPDMVATLVKVLRRECAHSEK
jgi:GNAT superfamily N-acetyltransferase